MTLSEQKGSIAWMAKNPVAANLLMIFLMVGGILTSFTVKQEVFPPFEVDTIYVSVPYLGASPEEVENGLLLAMEESVRDIEGIKQINSTAREGSALMFVDLLSGTNGNKALQDVKNAIDRITNWPEEAERPTISLIVARMSVITIVIYGDLDDKTLRSLAEKARDELLDLPDITNVSLSGVRPLEISIEIPKETLRKYGLTLSGVARMVRAASVDYSAGGVKARSGEILLRVKERKDYGRQYADIPIVSRVDGTAVRLGEIANIKDGFEETDESAFYNGKPAVMIEVTREGDQTPIEVAEAVLNYLENDLGPNLPAGVSYATFDNRADHYRDRVDLLLRNAAIGLALVLVLLGMFLNLRLAFWVTLGIPLSFLGAILFMPSWDVSINMVSLFAFIMALGIVVDDAIVIGENIYTLRRQGMNRIEAAIVGARELAVPVTFAVLTNIVAFLPLMFVEGVMGKIFKVVPAVVCTVFMLSLVEALYILPAHMGHSKKAENGNSEGKGLEARFSRFQGRISRGLLAFVDKYYRPLLVKSLGKRYVTIAAGIAIITTVIGYIAGGHIPLTFMPKAEADMISVGLELPFGSSVEETKKVQERLVAAAERVLERHGGKKIYDGIFTHIGISRFHDVGTFKEGGHAANIRIFLKPSDQRSVTGERLSQEWREEMGEIPGVEKIFFQVVELGPPVGSPVDIQLSHRDHYILEAASAELAEGIEKYSATADIDDGFAPGKPQLDFKIKPVAYSLGLTPSEIGAQVRGAFYGAEAMRLQRGRDEVKVMVRLPEAERKKELSIENLVIRTPAGTEAPLAEVANVQRGRAYTEITRLNGRRTLNVTAEVVPITEKGNVLDSIMKTDLARLMEKYPGLSYTLGGEQQETDDSMKSLMRNFIIAMIAIFVMLGVEFRSYIQPVIIMVSIPFGIVGAVVGHIIMGFNLTMVSMLGMTALAGVVLNDSLVLIDYANTLRRSGMGTMDSIVEAAVRRFRPILLTTLTTFFGLMPMILEKSFQARILVPMAISMGFGILFSTAIILLLVPSLYISLEDVKNLFGIKNIEEAIKEVKEEKGESPNPGPSKRK